MYRSIFYSALFAAALALSCVTQANAGERNHGGGQPVCNHQPGDYLKGGQCHHADKSATASRTGVGKHRHADVRGGGGNSAASLVPAAKHAEQLALCNEQAGKRRALGIDSKVTWDNPFTCRANGGMVQTGRI